MKVQSSIDDINTRNENVYIVAILLINSLCKNISQKYLLIHNTIVNWLSLQSLYLQSILVCYKELLTPLHSRVKLGVK